MVPSATWTQRARDPWRCLWMSHRGREWLPRSHWDPTRAGAGCWPGNHWEERRVLCQAQRDTVQPRHFLPYKFDSAIDSTWGDQGSGWEWQLQEDETPWGWGRWQAVPQWKAQLFKYKLSSRGGWFMSHWPLLGPWITTTQWDSLIHRTLKGGNWNIHKWGKWDPLLLEKYERTWENESSNGSAYTRSDMFDPKNQKYQSFAISLEALSCLKVTHRGDNIGLLSATAPEALRFGQLCLKFQGSL